MQFNYYHIINVIFKGAVLYLQTPVVDMDSKTCETNNPSEMSIKTECLDQAELPTGRNKGNVI